MLSIVYDLPTAYSANDPIITNVNNFVERLAHYAGPGNYAVEFFTWMRYLPSSIAKWKKDAEDGYNEYSKMFLGLFRDVENRIVMSFIRFSLPPDIIVGRQKQGDERPCFAGVSIREPERYQLSRTEGAWLAASM